MRVSRKGMYAVESMVVLADNDSINMSVSEVANARHCSFKFLEHVFRDLKNAGLVVSVRGKNGGYQITKDPADITCKEIVLAVENHLSTAPCSQDVCPQAGSCMTQKMWCDLQLELYRELEEITLQDLVDSYREAVHNEINYQI
ncbi:Rrf2 family iron-sulfur cluster assembly transcriptional regulator [Breznakia sp. PF5-3]|uniref:RrF2 family transcriptional regulator n=1 Tax=unclassified Breznakia TaxID=2623764 RepID=UPI002407597E|nr:MULTISPECIES: Rrf2 family transcriptional regulator [unclassified Breznakia]MDL2276847.1 Rrf2 family transcriptional regulator [Breznakia sp. OttesenSCG-928-G09]MDF9823943.1 Rrf2 family iron-sulfur cluster assembly transcriptional regulator [Breznakia sp. PM6-1]MDF9834742.1 Rrf2 family iron-sulfur cluster assembly transcriptional regulator [Breznakia sp. PF5-3]MDF9836822.1 Rrf2 family iron-sulfur cluster assembly transcriptional regulator [Breznakia sp. PFB2-8]MDF9858840.1 Rrf2 family iron-